MAIFSLVIEIKEAHETKFVEKGFQQAGLFQECKPMLYMILKRLPLNGRNIDARYELRKHAMTLLSLFFSTVICIDAEHVKEYL